jgi:hypothetical protein
VVGAHLERLVTSHHKTSLAIFAMLEQSDVTSTALFPLARFAIEFEKLSSHLESALLEFFVSLGLDFLREADNGFEVDIWLDLLDLLLIL